MKGDGCRANQSKEGNNCRTAKQTTALLPSAGSSFELSDCLSSGDYCIALKNNHRSGIAIATMKNVAPKHTSVLHLSRNVVFRSLDECLNARLKVYAHHVVADHLSENLTVRYTNCFRKFQ